MLVNINVITTSGWIAVQRDVLIDFNPEQYSLNIMTDSTLGSNDKVAVQLYTSQGDYVGGLTLYFTSTPQYWIGACSMADTDSFCNTCYTNFPTNLPSANDKVWRVTLTRTSGIRLMVHCNEVEVLNILMSDSTCGYSYWSTKWSREVAKIKFYYHDTASDYYQTQQGNCVFLTFDI